MLSIIIPTKNEETCLPRLLESIKAQTVQPFEIIVADAQSTDATCVVARQCGARVVKGGLPGEARNHGAKQARTDLLLFLDADVELIDHKFLEKSICEMFERDLDAATCDILPMSSRRIDHAMHAIYNLYVRAWGSVLPHAPGFCLFARREAHKKINGFDETITLAEDMDYVRRLGRIGSFGILCSTKIPVSVRRMDRDGRLWIAGKYLLGEIHTMVLGPIRHQKFDYTFGHDALEDTETCPHDIRGKKR